MNRWKKAFFRWQYKVNKHIGLLMMQFLVAVVVALVGLGLWADLAESSSIIAPFFPWVSLAIVILFLAIAALLLMVIFSFQGRNYWLVLEKTQKLSQNNPKHAKEARKLVDNLLENCAGAYTVYKKTQLLKKIIDEEWGIVALELAEKEAHKKLRTLKEVFYEIEKGDGK